MSQNQTYTVRVYKGNVTSSPTFIDYEVSSPMPLQSGSNVTLVKGNGDPNYPLMTGGIYVGGAGALSNVLSSGIRIDSTGVKSIDIPHGLTVTPPIQNCALTLVQDTNVDDWACGFIKTIYADQTYVHCKVNVTAASSTSGATVKLALSLTAAADVNNGGLLWSDAFANMNAWTVRSGSWSVANNTLYGSASGAAMITAGVSSWANYSVTLIVQIAGSVT
jgi:hypothetical protein